MTLQKNSNDLLILNPSPVEKDLPSRAAPFSLGEGLGVRRYSCTY